MKKSKIRWPKVKDYRSVTHTTANENGVEELKLELPLTLWEKWVYAVKNRTLDIPETQVKAYLAKGPYWIDKDTGMIPDETSQYECYEAKAWLRYNNFLEK